MSVSSSAHPEFCCVVSHVPLSPRRRRKTLSALKKKAKHPLLLQPRPKPLALRASQRSRPALPWAAAAAPLQAGAAAGASRACAPTLAAAAGRRVWRGLSAAATGAVGRRHQRVGGASGTYAATGTLGTTGTAGAGTRGTAGAGTQMGGGVKRKIEMGPPSLGGGGGARWDMQVK